MASRVAASPYPTSCPCCCSSCSRRQQSCRSQVTPKLLPSCMDDEAARTCQGMDDRNQPSQPSLPPAASRDIQSSHEMTDRPSASDPSSEVEYESAKLGRQARRYLRLHDRTSVTRTREKRQEAASNDDEDDEPSDSKIPNKKQKSLEGKEDTRSHQEPEGQQSGEESSISQREQVAELAGYLNDMYLPRDTVSADVAIMKELMYT